MYKYQQDVTERQAINLLSMFDAAARRELLAIAQLREFDKDELICQTGEMANHVYILETGQAKIYQLGPQGKEVLLWFCFAGEAFGLNEAFQRRYRTTYAQACQPCRVISVQRELFRQFLCRYPTIALHVIDMLTLRLRDVEQRIQRLVSMEVNERLLLLLSHLADRFGVKDKRGVRIELRITHQDIADMIGSSRQSVTTSLNHLKRQGMLQMEHRHLWITHAAISHVV